MIKLVRCIAALMCIAWAGGEARAEYPEKPLRVIVSFIPSGRVKALAVAGTRRLASLPSVPTTREAGLPEFVAGTAFGIYAKGGTPAPIVARLNAEINKVITIPDVSKHLVSLGLDPGAISVEAYTQQYRKDLARWKNVVARAKLPLQD